MVQHEVDDYSKIRCNQFVYESQYVKTHKSIFDYRVRYDTRFVKKSVSKCQILGAWFKKKVFWETGGRYVDTDNCKAVILDLCQYHNRSIYAFRLNQNKQKGHKIQKVEKDIYDVNVAHFASQMIEENFSTIDQQPMFRAIVRQ